MVDLVAEAVRLDWRYIETKLADLADLKEDPGLLPRLRSIRESAERR